MNRVMHPRLILTAVGMVLLWTLLLWATRRFHAVHPLADGVIGMLVIGGPAMLLGRLTGQLRRLAGYLLCAGLYLTASAFSTMLLAEQGSRHAMSLQESLMIGLVHLGSLSLLVLSSEGGFLTHWGNLLWLALALSAYSVGLDLRKPATPRAPEDRHPRRARRRGGRGVPPGSEGG